MQLLRKIFGPRALADQKLPKVNVKVSGFEVSVTLKEGVLLKGHKKDAPEQQLDLSEPTYYEIAIRQTGENPDYPAREEPYIVPCTITTPDYRASGMNGNTMYISAGGRYVEFELTEEFDDMKKPKMGPIRGTEFPPHHTVMLTAHYKNEDGRRGSWSAGFAVRKSETDSPAWKAAASSPILGMYI